MLMAKICPPSGLNSNLRAIVFSLALMGGLPAAFAQTTWSGADVFSPTTGWADSLNWTNGIPGANAIFFDGSTGLTNGNDIPSLSITGLTFNSTAGAFVLGGSTFTVTNNITDLSATNIETMNMGITLGATPITFNVVNGGSLLVAGAIGQSTTDGLTKSGLGTLTLAGANTYTGNTTVNSGTLTLGFTQSGAPTTNILSTSSVVTLAGGTLNVTGLSSSSTQALTGFGLTAGASTVNVTGGATLTLGAFNNMVTGNGGNPGSTVQFNGPATSTGATTSSGQSGSGGSGTGFVAATGTITTTTQTGSLTVGTNIVLVPAVNGAASKGAFATVGLYDFATQSALVGGVYTLMGISQGTGGTAGDGGYTLENGVTVGSPATGTILDLMGTTVTFSTSDSSSGGLRFNANGATTAVGSTTFSVGGILVTPNVGAFNIALTSGVQPGQRSGNSGGQIDIFQNNNSGFLNVSAIIANDSHTNTLAGNIAKSGTGTMVLSGVNTYTGGTFLNGGVTEINADSGLGAPATAFSLALNGGTLLGGATFSLDNSGANKRPIALGNNGGGLAAVSGATMTVSGVVSGANGLTIGIPASSANGNTVGLVPGTGAETANTAAVNATGTVVLSNAANTYTGGTIVYDSTLSFASLGAGAVTLNGGTLQWDGVTTDVSSQLVLGAGTDTLDANGNAITLAGAVGNGGPANLAVQSSVPGGLLTLNGANTFTGGLTLTNGTLTLGGTNVYTAATAVNGGTLKISPGGSLSNTAITVASGATFAANPGSGTISLGTGSTSANASLTLNGGATFSMVDGATGTLLLNPGSTTTSTILSIGNSSAAANLDFEISSSGGDLLQINGSGQISYGADGGIIFITGLGSTVPTTLTYTLISDTAGGLGTGSLTLGGNIVSFGSTAFTLDLTASTSTAEILTLTPASVDYYWTGATSSSWSTLSNFATTHTGGTTQLSPISSGSNIFLTADSASNFAQTLNGSVAVNSLSFTGTGTAAAGNSITLSAGTPGSSTLTLVAANAFGDANGNSYPIGTGLVVQAGSAVHTINTNILLGRSQTWEIDNAATSPMTVNGVVGDSGSGFSLTKTGVGELILTNLNTYSGGTVVTGGTLGIGQANALLTTAPLTVNGTGTFDLAGFNQTVASLSDGGSTTGTVTSSSGTPTLTLGGGSYAGNVTGSLALTLNPSATVTLGGNNTYTGLTSVTNGDVLTATSNGALGLSTSVNNGLAFNTTTTLAAVNFTSPNPSIAVLTATSNSSLNIITLGNATGSIGTTLNIDGATPSVFNGTINDASPSAIGSINVSGTSSLTFNGTNTYSGNTTVGPTASLILGTPLAIQNSFLNLSSASGLSFGNITTATIKGLNTSSDLSLTNTNLTPAGVALTITGSGPASTVSGNLTGLGSLIQNGGILTLGNLTLDTGANYTGTTELNGGNLTFGGTSNLTRRVDVSGLDSASHLIITDNATLNTTGALILASAGGTAFPLASTLLVSGNANITVPSFAIGATSRVPNGSGFTLNSGTMTVTGQVGLNETEGGTASNNFFDLNGGTWGVGNFTSGGNQIVGSNQLVNLQFNGTTLVAEANDPAGGAFLPYFVTLTANVDFVGGFILNTNGFNDTVAAQLVHGIGTTDAGLTKLGNGMLTLSNATNTYNGPTTINGGTLSVDTLATGAPSELGNTTSAASNLVFNGGTLRYTGAGTSTDRTFTVDSVGAGFDSSGTGPVVYSNTTAPTFTGSSPVTFTFSGNNTGANTFAAPITDNGANSSSLVLNGPGNWTLTGTNTYTGTTTLNGGTLQGSFTGTTLATINAGTLTNSTVGGALTINNGSLLSSTIGGSAIVNNGTMDSTSIAHDVTINGGTMSGPSSVGGNLTVLGGSLTASGSIGGNLELATGTFLSPGGTLVGNLTANSVLLAPNVSLSFLFASSTSFDQVFSNTSLEIDSSSNITLLGSGSSPWDSPGNYSLFSFGGGFIGNPNNLIVANPQTGWNYNFADISGNIVLEITSAGLLNEWNSTTGGSWGSPSNAGNWSFNSFPSATATVSFFSTISQNASVTLDGNQQAGAIQFASSEFSYSIDPGTGGNLTLGNSTRAGEIDVLQGNHSITAPVMLTAGGLTTNVTTGDVLTISGVIGQNATAALTSIGSGNLILSGLNTYTGVTTINAGTVAVTNLANGGSPSSLGQSTNAASNLVLNGGTLRYIGAGSSTDRLFTLGSSGGRISASGTGPVNFTNPNPIAFSTPDVPVALTLSGSNTGTNTFAPALNDNGAGATSLTKSGTGLWLVTGNNTQSGVTTISGGTLQINTLVNGSISQSSSTFGPAAEPSCQTTASSTNIFIGDTSVLTANMTVTGPGIPSGDTIATVNGDGSIDLVTPANSTATVALNFSGVPVVTVSDSTQFTVGEAVTGVGIPTGSTILSIDNVQDTVTISQNATATNAASNLNFFTANPLGGTTNAAANLVIDGGTLQYVGPASSTDRLFTIGINGTTLDASGTGPINFTNGGSVAFVGTTSTSLTLTGNNTGNNTLAATITDSSPGLTSVVKSGPGIWALTGTNTYSGGTNITAGTLQIAGDSNFGVTSSNATIGNGTLEDQASFTSAHRYILTNANSTIMVDDGLAVTIAGNITGAGTLNISWNNGPLGSMLTLSGTGNTYSGGTIVNGTLAITTNTALGSGGVTLLNNSNLTVTNAPQSLGNNITIPAGDTGNLTFASGGSTSYSGLIADSATSVLNMNVTSNPLSLNGNATTQFGSFNGTLNIFLSGSGGGRLFGVTNFANATINLESNTGSFFTRTSTTVSIGALTGVVGSLLGSASTDTGTTTWQIGSLNTNDTFGGNITQGTSTAALNKVGTGILFLTGTNLYSGNTTYTAGEINFGSLTNIGNGTQNFNGGALQWATGTSTDVSVLPTFFNTGGGNFDTNGNDVTLGGAIGGHGPGGFTKSGNGSLTLDGIDVYNGTTTISTGSIIMGNAAAVPSNSTVSVASGTTLNVNGFAAVAGQISGAGQILLGTGGSLTTGGNNLTTTFNGMISGSADLGVTKTGTGSLTLSALQSYTGPTLVSAGNLVLTSGLTASSVTVNSGAALLSGPSTTISRNVTLNGGGMLYTGGTSSSLLTIGNLTWNTNGTAGIFMALSDSGSASDSIMIAGNLTGGTGAGPGQFVFNFEHTGFFGGVYTLLDFPAGQSSGLDSSDFGAVNVQANYGGVFDFNNSTGELTFTINVVPEPATWTLLLGCSALLFGLWRKRIKFRQDHPFSIF
jgi:autotransporter-associated beta strand protein